MTKTYIYADNAATTKLDSKAFEAMMAFMKSEYGNASQPYSFAREPKKALKEARRIIAECINCLPEEIFFTSGGTESDNWALKGSVFADEQKRAVITSSIEHHAVLNSCKFIEMMGIPVAYLNPDKTGTITEENLKSLITNHTRLVSVMFANNEIGTIQPIKSLAEIAHNNGALFHTDAVQAIGHIDIDVQKLGVDMLSASAHKFNGPKGIGFLYVKKGTDLSPLIHGGAQESGNRAGTENVAAIVGMAVALKNNCDNIIKNQEYIKQLEEALLSKLEESSVEFVRNGINQIPGNISLSFKKCSGEAILHRLDLRGIEISTGSACDSVNTQVSHVIKAIGVPKEYAEGTIRISLGKDNTVDDAKIIAEELVRVLKVI